jgi:hypothetical protein
MGRELWHGHFSLFLWGQNFGGAIEVLPVAIVTKLFGTSLLAQRATTMVLGAVAAWLGMRIAGRLAGPGPALITGAVLWLWPLYFISWSVSEFVYYEPAIVLGLSALWWTVRGWEAPRSWVLPVLVGVAMGLGWWVTPNIAAFVLPVVLGLLWLEVGRWRRCLLAVAGAVLGAAPWIAFNVRHHLASLDPGTLNQHASYLTRLHELAREGGAVALGLERWNRSWVGPWAHPLYVILLVLGAVGCVRAVVVWRRNGGRPPIDVAGIVAYPFLYALSPVVGSAWVPRYFFFATPWVAFAAGRLFQPGGREYQRHSRAVSGAGRAWLAVALAGAVAISALSVKQAAALTQTPGIDVFQSGPANVRALSTSLKAHGATRVFTGYWYAYTLDVAGGGGIVATPALPSLARYKPYDREVRASPRPVWVLVRGSIKDRTFVSWLQAQHIEFSRFSPAGFDVFVPTRKVLPESVPVTVLVNASEGP